MPLFTTLCVKYSFMYKKNDVATVEHLLEHYYLPI